ncbi:MAG: hypothetical protein CVT64_04320 [Actinobacteria bacterium HGW-Actinobacteria-4]|nr:MAG: hypothetical protein CVT64_04320 [Actinobacteria bacterium HGW-Actinobacteria-4]
MTKRLLLALAPFVGAVAVVVGGVAVIVVANDSARAGATVPSSAFDSVILGESEETGEAVTRPIIASAYPFAYGDDRTHASDWVIVTKPVSDVLVPVVRPAPRQPLPDPYFDDPPLLNWCDFYECP